MPQHRISDLDIYLFGRGTHYTIYEKLGAHPAAENGQDGKIYPVGSGQCRPLREYFEILRDAVDPSLPLGFGELPYPPGQVMRLQADISELAKDTGFRPRYTFEEAAKTVVKAYRERKEG